MSNKAINGVMHSLQSIGISPVILFAVISTIASVFFLRRGDLKNWEKLDTPTKMNDITIFGAAVVFILFTFLQVLGILVLKF